MKYTKEQIDAVNDLDIVEVARKLGIDVKEHKGVFMACCVDHTENTPSMQIGSRKEDYRHMTKCYSCGKKHNVIGLVMRVNNCTFPKAMEWASQFTDLTAPPTPQGGRQHFERAACLRSTVRGSASSPRGDWGYSNLTKCQGAPTKGSDISYRDGGRREKGAIGREEGAAYGTIKEVGLYVDLNNALSQCLRYYFSNDIVNKVTTDYLLGTDYELCRYPHTLFCSIDVTGHLHNVKAQGYCTTPTSPQFCHSTKGDTRWLGKAWQESGRLAKSYDIDTECLFGEHLLKRYPEKVVALVESPKNAIVGACHEPRLLWLACGNKGMLKRELLEVLRGRDVIVYPDRDAVEEWTQKIESMRGLAHFRMADFCKDKTSPENEKMDIADLILNSIRPLSPVSPRGRSATA